MSYDLVGIGDALAAETKLVGALQRRSSDIWEEYREQLVANPLV